MLTFAGSCMETNQFCVKLKIVPVACYVALYNLLAVVFINKFKTAEIAVDIPVCTLLVHAYLYLCNVIVDRQFLVLG